MTTTHLSSIIGTLRCLERSSVFEVEEAASHRLYQMLRIAGPRGEKSPTWLAEDDVNITGDIDTMHRKFVRLNQGVVDAVFDLFTAYQSHLLLFRKLRNIELEVQL